MKNKKGFTLVELLAVIVILALIMSIAIISIGGVLDSAKTDTFKETAASIIDGVKKQLLIKNKLEPGDYQYTSGILEKIGEPPFGGSYTYGSCDSSAVVPNLICKVATQSCSDAATSFVRIADDANKTASICLTTGSGNKFINLGTETDLLNKSNTSMIS